MPQLPGLLQLIRCDESDYMHLNTSDKTFAASLRT